MKKEERTCKVEGCGRTDIKAKGYCTKHWQRIKRNGTPDLVIEYNGPRRQYPKEYKSWDSMRQRCLNPNHKYYKHYGGKGIKICDRWQGAHGFANFIADMGSKPFPKYSIDRIDPSGDYCPENCRWGSPRQQACNRNICGVVPGVTKASRCNTWIARYRAGGKNLRKNFKTFEEAVAQRKKWEKEYPLD